jgi:hypothetical protein
MAPEAKAGGKKILGMSPTTAALVGGGTLIVGYFGYKYLKSRSSTTSSVTTGTTAGGTIPASLSMTPGSSSTGGTAAPATFTAWIKKAFAATNISGYNYATFLNDVNAWLTGQCVSSNGYKALNSVLPTLGAPTNRAGATSKITVCSTRTKGTTPAPTTKGTTPAPTTKATTPAPTTKATTARSTPGAKTFQHAMTGSTTHAFGGKIFSDISTWAQTLSLAAKGEAVYLWTTTTGKPYRVTLAQLKQIEHTGTHKYAQFRTFLGTTSRGSKKTYTTSSGGPSSGTGGPNTFTKKYGQTRTPAKKG